MLPDKQLLLDEVDGLSEIPDSTLESIATAGLIEFLQGTPLNPSLPKQPLVTAANPLQCLKRQEVLALLVRKLLDVLEQLGSTTSAEILEWAMAPSYRFVDRTYDGTNVILAGTVIWPDGSAGVYTRTSKNNIWNVVDAYTVTHADSGVIVTQNLLVRDGSGNVTHQPPLVLTIP